MKKINLKSLAQLLAAWQTTVGSSLPRHKTHNEEYEAKIYDLLKDLPSGNGIEDSILQWHVSQPDLLTSKQELIFFCRFRHLDAGGHYDGTTEHKIVIRPIFGGFDLIVRGSNKNDIKELLHQVWSESFEI